MSVLDNPFLQFFKSLPKGEKLKHDYIIQFKNGVHIDKKVFNTCPTGIQSGPWEPYADGFRGHTSMEEEELMEGLVKDLHIHKEDVEIIRVSNGWNFVKV